MLLPGSSLLFVIRTAAQRHHLAPACALVLSRTYPSQNSVPQDFSGPAASHGWHGLRAAFEALSARHTRHVFKLLYSRVSSLPLLARLSSLSVLSTTTDGAKSIGTHSGKFHCDEALAVAMLKLLPRFQDHDVVRTRDPEMLKLCEVVVDVGAEYDADTLRFDHHQRSFDGVLEPFSTKLSSAGLVYRHFGREVLQEVAEGCSSGVLAGSGELLDLLYERVYRTFVEHIDGIDNGIAVADGQLRYRVSTSLSDRVNTLNPRWNEDRSSEAANAAFQHAVLLTGQEFVGVVEGLVNAWWPARSIVQKALQTRGDVHPSGEIVQLETLCPWESHIFELEPQERSLEEGSDQLVKYVVYQDSAGSWRVQAVPETEGSFVSRKKLPAAWRGVRDEELDKLVGISGCIFVHAAGFIGGHKTLEGAKKMAIDALTLE